MSQYAITKPERQANDYVRALTEERVNSCVVRDARSPGADVVVVTDQPPAAEGADLAAAQELAAATLARVVEAHRGAEHPYVLTMTKHWPASAGLALVRGRLRPPEAE